MELATEILRDTDRCVLCGTCLPHCPTYRLFRTENESPRGRISLIQAAVSGRLEATPRLLAHLDRCLLCRACERACPSQVPYGRLMLDARRALKPAARSRARLPHLLTQGSRYWVFFARLYQRSGLQRLIRRFKLLGKGRLARMEGLLPPLTAAPTLPAFSPAFGVEKGRVALFVGCIGPALSGETLDAALQLLRLFGYGVYIPKGQGCCGAVDLAAGNRNRGARLADENRDAFALDDIEAVVTVASGCGATLQEYAELFGKEKGLTVPVRDISDFLAASKPQVAPAPLPQAIAVHEPCSLRNVLRQEQGVYRLLRLIPGAEAAPLPGNDQCCGAAGSYLLTQPAIADALLDKKLAAIAASGAQLVVTSNIGCAMHMNAGLRRVGSRIEVLHPAQLLARQLRKMGQGPQTAKAQEEEIS